MISKFFTVRDGRGGGGMVEEGVLRGGWGRSAGHVSRETCPASAGFIPKNSSSTDLAALTGSVLAGPSSPRVRRPAGSALASPPSLRVRCPNRSRLGGITIPAGPPSRQIPPRRDHQPIILAGPSPTGSALAARLGASGRRCGRGSPRPQVTRRCARPRTGCDALRRRGRCAPARAGCSLR